MKKLFCGLSVLLFCGAFSQKDDSLISRDFEGAKGADGWKTFREADKIELIKRSDHPGDVKFGDSALCYTFTPTGGSFPVAYMEVGDLTGMKALDVWVKTDLNAVLVFALSEKAADGQPSGENYNAWLYAKGQEWTHATIPIEAFKWDENSPKGNGKLDLNSLSVIGFVDIFSIFVTGNEQLKVFFGDHGGQQRICVDNLTILPSYRAKTIHSSDIAVDLFDRNYQTFIPFKDVDLSLTSMASTLSGQGLRAKYDRQPGKLLAWLKNIAPGSVSGAASVSFKTQSSQEIQLYVGLEETDGGKWQSVLTVPGGNAVTAQSIKLADFRPADDSKDPDKKLSPEKIKMISFLDMTQDPGKGSITIGDLVMKK